MKIIKKIRLKKDTPDHKAGELFVLMSNNDIYEIDAGEDDHSVFHGGDIKNFDEWFEEVKESEWVRKQIKRVDVTAAFKYTEVQYRFITPFYHDDTEWGVDVYAKNSTSYQRFYMYDTPDKSTYLNKVALINQLVRDGYIEIQDNPNIVWENDSE